MQNKKQGCCMASRFFVLSNQTDIADERLEVWCASLILISRVGSSGYQKSLLFINSK